MNSLMKSYIGQGLEGFQVQKLLEPWDWGGPPSLHINAPFTYPVTHQILFKSFDKA